MNEKDMVKFLRWFTGYNVIEKNIYGGEDHNESFEVKQIAYKYDTYVTGFNYHYANEINKLVDFIEWFIGRYEILNRQIYNIENGDLAQIDTIVDIYDREKYNEINR